MAGSVSVSVRQRVRRQQRENLIPVDHPAALIAQHATIAVAVVRDAQPRSGCEHARRQLLSVFAADPGVDVAAVGGVAQADDLGAKRPQHHRTRRARRPVRGVEHDAPARESRGR